MARQKAWCFDKGFVVSMVEVEGSIIFLSGVYGVERALGAATPTRPQAKIVFSTAVGSVRVGRRYRLLDLTVCSFCYFTK